MKAKQVVSDIIKITEAEPEVSGDRVQEKLAEIKALSVSLLNEL